MSEIIMGKTTTDTHTIVSEKSEGHTFITGQSGCGKSTLLGRYIEELILNDCGNVLLFDCNLDFANFKVPDEDAFKNVDWNLNLCNYDSYSVFKDKWEEMGMSDSFQILQSKDINILFHDISPLQLMNLFNIDMEKHPGCFWLFDLIKEDKSISNKLKSKTKFLQFIEDVGRWGEDRLKKGESNKIRYIYDIKRHLCQLDYTKLINAAKNVSTQKNISFKRVNTTLDLNFFEKVFDNSRFISIDLLNFKYEERNLKHFIVLHSLQCLWKQANKNLTDKKMGVRDKLKRVFIVIDEAHNIIPNDPSSSNKITNEVIEILRTIAAEGRKFKLFLILISQRPDKIDPKILSECTNFMIMSLNSVIAFELEKTMYISGDKADEIRKELLGLTKTKDVIFCGDFIDGNVIKIKRDLRRTTK